MFYVRNMETLEDTSFDSYEQAWTWAEKNIPSGRWYIHA